MHRNSSEYVLAAVLHRRGCRRVWLLSLISTAFSLVTALLVLPVHVSHICASSFDPSASILLHCISRAAGLLCAAAVKAMAAGLWPPRGAAGSFHALIFQHPHVSDQTSAWGGPVGCMEPCGLGGASRGMMMSYQESRGGRRGLRAFPGFSRHLELGCGRVRCFTSPGACACSSS